MSTTPPGGIIVGARSPRIAATGARPRRLVIVSNRVPSPDKAKTSTGGLATAVLAALRENGGIWFGWSGEVVDKQPARPNIIETGRITYVTVDLTRRDYDEYYAGFSNSVLWPLFHFRASLVDFGRRELGGYLRVNAEFARQLHRLLRPDDLIWVHDYHLIPLAQELRKLNAQQPIGFFLHTPFPPAEMLRVLPNHGQIMECLCAYDLVGFQTAPDLDGFRDYVLREAQGVALGPHRLGAFGRQVTTGVFPIGIDVDMVAEQAEAAASSRQTERLVDSLVGRQLIIGVDRLDYSKGLVRRFEAFSRLLELYPETHGRVTFMQIAPPTRSDVPEYMEIRKALEAASGNINGRYADPEWTPLRYLNQSFANRTLTGFFRASKVGLVTPFRDGMNLVAKEYVASQDGEDPGVLVLSSFAGAAREMKSALIVNPYDLDSIAEAMAKALDMSRQERQERWNDMMRVLRRNDIAAWREAFVARLTELSVHAD
jgi:trehalose 6-phosphate synthase